MPHTSNALLSTIPLVSGDLHGEVTAQADKLTNSV